jgi:hypothetical protein
MKLWKLALIAAILAVCIIPTVGHADNPYCDQQSADFAYTQQNWDNPKMPIDCMDVVKVDCPWYHVIAGFFGYQTCTSTTCTSCRPRVQ